MSGLTIHRDDEQQATVSRPRPPHLQRHKTRHGKYNWYVQLAGGPLVRIREEFGTPEFDRAYQAAIANYQPIKPSTRAAPGSFEWGWFLYKQSGAWEALSPATRKQRDNIMVHVLAKAGKLPLSKLTTAAVQDGVDRRASTPFQAKNFLQTIRQWGLWLKRNGHISVDPGTGVELKKPKTRGFPEWTYDEILKYEERWPLGTRQRVAFDVYCYTGLRRGDAARVGPGHVHGNTITLATEKSQGNTIVHIPILDVLKRTLDAGPTGPTSFIVTPSGKPYRKEALGNVFKEWCVAAGVPDKSAHGLRKAAATRAADNGATAHELMAIFGWLNIKEAEIYTRAADRKRLAAAAINKLER